MNAFIRVAAHATLCLLFTLAAPAYSQTTDEINRGIQWLNGQLLPSGTIQNESVSVATPFQNRAEVFQTLSVLASSPSALTDSIAADTESNTEYLSRQIIALSSSGKDFTPKVSELLTRQNADGGFGGADGYESNALDTAWALLAISSSGQTAPAALGFLKAVQQADGSFLAGRRPDIHVTAMVLLAIRPYAGTYALSTIIQSAVNYLMAQQSASGSWNEVPWLTAAAYLALHDFISHEPTASAVRGFLAATQHQDGSWAGDPYETSLVLRALSLTGVVPVNPMLAVIQGKVIDSQTGLPLAGVAATLSGMGNATLNTGTDGIFVFRDLEPGSYNLAVSLSGYSMLTANTAIKAGQVLDFGTMQLTKTQNATTGTVHGIIKEASTGQPLSDVTVTVGGVTTPGVTDTAGSYQIANVPAGPVAIQMQKDGYAPMSGSGTLSAGGMLVFSTALSQATTPQTSSTVQGRVTDGTTGAPIAGVSVTVGGANSASATSNAQGEYSITGLDSGPLTIVAAHASYDSVSASTTLSANTILTFSPKLYASGTTPAAENKAGVAGVVVDAGTNEPLANVNLRVIGKTVSTVTTGPDGSYLVTGLSEPTVDIEYSVDGYQGITINVALQPLEILELGQIRLRRDKVDQLLPDLTVQSVERSGAVTDPHSLRVSGSVFAKIANIGTESVPAGVHVLAFHDANRNAAFDPEVDQVLGQASLSTGLGVTAVADVLIQVAGTLPFRDAPIHVLVDSAQSIVELTKENNVRSTAAAIEIKPDIGTFVPKLKWQWKGSSQFPTHRAVEMAPMVMRTHDTNDDGKIDANDTPSVAFLTFDWYNWSNDGVFRIVSGKDGSDLVAVKKPGGVPLTGWSSIAAADLDGDGLVEFVVALQDGRLAALSNTGQLKWTANLPLNSAMWFTFGGPNIVDLDGNGQPSILFGPYVVNYDGTLRWKASGTNVGGQNNLDYGAIAADLDLDGRPEVIIGGQAYDRDGKLLWNNTTARDGLTAVANFNEDPYPEVVVVSHGKVLLLDHAGKTIWGPVSLPGGGNGGPPVIADFTGTGTPGIGVAGRSRYTAFHADGSVLWSVPIEDFSSSRTGSTVFDFDGDGRAEVVYADETKLHVFNGVTGATVFEQPTASSTAAEYPVVVDLDNDNHADLVVPGSRNGPYTGIRVFQDLNNSWVNTRSIWNQFAYHITNINDDGSVPKVEQNSWEVHNTYRLNTRPGISVTAVPDVTASYLRVNDRGGQAASTLTVRIGNASTLALNAGMRVAFYNGQPGAGGILLGTVATSRKLGSGEYEDVALIFTDSLSGIATLVAVADDDGTGKSMLTDFDRGNNSVSMQLSALPGSFGLSVATDKASYGANSDVQLTATVANNGSFNGTAQVRFIIQTAQGEDVAVLPTQSVTVVRGGQQTAESVWNSGTFLTGPYQVKAQLVDANGSVYNEASAAFSIEAGTASLSSGLTTDKISYLPSEVVQIRSRLSNLTANALLNNLVATTTVTNPDGSLRFSTTEALPQLAQGNVKEYSYSLPLQFGDAGSYGVELLVTANGVPLAQSGRQFVVISSAESGSGLQGMVAVSAKQVMLGDSVAMSFSVSNAGNGAVPNLSLKVSVLDPTAQLVMAEFPYTQTLDKGATYNGSSSWTSSGTVGNTYVAVLSATVGARTLTLAQDSFTLTAPPVKLTGSLTATPKEVEAGASVALLQQVASGLTAAKGVVVTLDITDAATGTSVHSISQTIDLGSHDSWQKALDWKPTGAIGTRYLTKLSATAGNLRFALGQDEFTVIAPPVKLDIKQSLTNGSRVLALVSCKYGLHEDITAASGSNGNDACVTDRSQLIAQTLTELGVPYAIATDEEDFKRALRSGLYNTYWISGKEDKLHDNLSSEVREAVFSGDGLLLDSMHDQRNKVLDTIAGITYKGKIGDTAPDVQIAGPLFDAQRLASSGRALRLDPAGSTVQAELAGKEGTSSGAAILTNAYGAGHAVAFAFDLVRSMYAEPNWKPVLARSLQHVMPGNQAILAPGALLTVQTTLTNLAKAVDADIRSALPQGASYLASSPAGNLNAGLNTINWAFALADAQARDLFLTMRVPAAAGSYALKTHVSTVRNGATTAYGEPLAVSFTVTSAAATAANAKEKLTALALSQKKDQKLRDSLVAGLQQAMGSFSQGSSAGYESAIGQLLQIVDGLGGLSGVDTAAVRQDLDQILREAQWRWSALQPPQ